MKTKDKKIVVHGSFTHPLGEPCDTCEKVIKEGDGWIKKHKSWEIDGDIHVRRKGEKYFTEVNGNEWLSTQKKQIIKQLKEVENTRWKNGKIVVFPKGERKWCIECARDLIKYLKEL